MFESAGVAPQVGDLYTLARPCLGNPAGTVAICYEVYRIGPRPGWSFLFPNGNYDGFSPGDLGLHFGARVGTVEELASYRFTNVTRLVEDFRRGSFDAAFRGDLVPA